MAGIADEFLARLQLSGRDVEVVPEPLCQAAGCSQDRRQRGGWGLSAHTALHRKAPYYEEAIFSMAKGQHALLEAARAQIREMRGANES